MKYYIMVLNARGDTIAVFETFDAASEYIGKGAMSVSSYRLQLIPIGGT